MHFSAFLVHFSAFLVHFSVFFCSFELFSGGLGKIRYDYLVNGLKVEKNC